MQYFYQNHQSNELIVFFAGWGCDQNQFVNLHDKKDVLILFDYNDLELNFDFTKYRNIYIISYSAGVFISTLWQDKIPNIRKKIALCGNPYLFDAKLGISKEKIKALQDINLDNYLDFRRKYMVFSEEEYEKYNELQSLRTFESCESELAILQELYAKNKDIIKPNFDGAYVAENDLFFNLDAQKEFYKNKLTIIPQARHHIFFRFNSFADILNNKLS